MNPRFHQAIALFDAENANDPNFEVSEGVSIPRELLYSRRLTDWVLKLDRTASEALQLAARSQHIRRWEIPRGDYSPDKTGYLRWRSRLKIFHSETAAGILEACGYDQELISRVKKLNLKLLFPNDMDSRTLEDALCLVFLEHQMAELAGRTERGKMINAIRKSWAKMSEAARAAALVLPLARPEKELVTEAIRPSPQSFP